VSRRTAYALYALLVLIWSSTWVAIKIGLEDSPALLGAGIRFTAAGALLLGFAAARRRPLKTDRALAFTLGVLPFAFCYGLVYWGEQYIPSGLTAVLFGVMPLYTAVLAALLLQDEPLRARLLAGVALALAGLALAFVESLKLGSADRAALGAIAVVLSPFGAALGNVAIKRRGTALDAVVLNGWGMLVGGALLLAVSGASEDWGDAVWGAKAIGSILYLALAGSAVAFVVLTVLLRELSAQASSFIALMIPFGALIFGAVLYSEPITGRAVAGAALVVAGLLAARGRPPAAMRRRAAARRGREAAERIAA
jgi:drug/metabolite transporter (DMT)-like permease